MKILNKLILILFFLTYGCSSQENEIYYKKNHQTLYNKNTKNDTIYIYFKHGINERLKIHSLDPPNTYKTYSFNFPKLKHHLKNFIVFYKFSNSLKRNKKGDYIEIKKIEKDKKFLRTHKDKIYTYKDFKNKSEKEIALFFSYNRFKTVYIIDDKENRNNSIYLREVGFSSSFPREQ